MEWKADCCKLKHQQNIVLENKKENPNEFSGKLRFNNPNNNLCYDVNVACQLGKERNNMENCDSLFVIFNTKDKEKLKEINSKHIQQKHFIEFKSGDLSGAFGQIISTVKIFGFKNKLNFGYVVRNPKKKFYASYIKKNLDKYSKAQKGKILFQIKKSNETITIN